MITGRYYYPRDPGSSFYFISVSYLFNWLWPRRIWGIVGVVKTIEGGRGGGMDFARRRELLDHLLGDLPYSSGQTPATCANIGLHNLYHGEIDLLVSSQCH